MQAFDKKDDIEYFAKSIEHDAIAKNDYNLSVSAYVEAEDTREVIDIAKLNAELKTTVSNIDKLRMDIDAIVAEIEGTKA
jgi:type I restriction enzyme M protein